MILSIFIFMGNYAYGQSINDKDAIQKYIIERKQILEIKILENQSSGYTWTGDIENGEILKLWEETTVENNDEEEKKVGANIIHVFRLKGMEKGKSKVIFKLEKKDEKIEPQQIKIIEVEVK